MKKSWAKKVVLFMLCNLLMISMLGGTASAFTAKRDICPLSTSNMQGGKTYGPWFGSSDVAYSNDIKGFSTIASAISNAVGRFSPEPVSKAIGQTLGPLFGVVAVFAPEDYVYGNIHKEYREVYVNGVFSYHQTKYEVTAWLHHNGQDTYGGKTTEYYEGGSPMSLGEIDS